MILIEQSFCWINLRKIGIIYSFINIILDVAVMFLAAIVTLILSLLGNMLTVAICFGVPYIILHLILIYGFCSRKPIILMWWLAFTPFHIIALQAIVLSIDVLFIVHQIETWIIIPLLLGHLILTTFMFHNVCVVFSVRHRLVNNQNGQNRDYSNSHVDNIGGAMKPLTTPEPQ